MKDEMEKGGYYIPGGYLTSVSFNYLILFYAWKKVINARIKYLLQHGRRNEALMLSRIEPEE